MGYVYLENCVEFVFGNDLVFGECRFDLVVWIEGDKILCSGISKDVVGGC